ncbi:MerR family transcriptional regulator [Psychrilyobacter atlanticus]|uniref:MerR family transcriptional regulator n=1 Tax=Psychrilyobacter atlanticus TaxID=271091 RepID=UPI0004212AC0|nr:MerR family transcriptional regulator [Psychrilyobacter atlanticus]
MYRIGDFSRICGVSIALLHHWEKVGILIPFKKNHENGYRYYDPSQIIKVYNILTLQSVGLSLKEIATLITLEDKEMLEILIENTKKIKNKISSLQETLRQLETNMFLIKNGGIPMEKLVTVKNVKPILVAYYRDKTDDVTGLNDYWQPLLNYISEKGGEPSAPCMTILYNNYFGKVEDKYDLAIVEGVSALIQSTEKFICEELPEVENMACIVHKGGYGSIFETYNILEKWINENEYKPKGALREIYHKGSWLDIPEEEYITELQIEIVK